tara:strand:+ start:94 stop:1140 length:1047 start_codon:yes stop_codon:yes gene_type:complete
MNTPQEGRMNAIKQKIAECEASERASRDRNAAFAKLSQGVNASSIDNFLRADERATHIRNAKADANARHASYDDASEKVNATAMDSTTRTGDMHVLKVNVADLCESVKTLKAENKALKESLEKKSDMKEEYLKCLRYKEQMLTQAVANEKIASLEAECARYRTEGEKYRKETAKYCKLYETYRTEGEKCRNDFNRTTKQVESLQQDLTNAKVNCVAYTAEIAELKARIADSDNATDAAELIQVSEMYNALKQTAEENERVLRDEIQSLNRSVTVSLSNHAMLRDRKKYYKSKMRDEVESHKIELERVLSEQFTRITKSIADFANSQHEDNMIMLDDHVAKLKPESATQ